MNDDLVALVTEFAWGVKLSRYQVGLMVDCCLDCQTNIPDWFLDDVLLFMPTPSHTPPFWTAKMFNPLVPGAPFSPYDIRDAKLNKRTCGWLFASIKIEYLRRKRLLRKPLYRTLDMPLTKAWKILRERLGDLTTEDIEPRGYMMSVVTNAMVAELSLGGPLSKWTPLFVSCWPRA